MGKILRRTILVSGTALVGGGLYLGWTLTRPHPNPLEGTGPKDAIAMNAFLRLDPDGMVTIALPRAEMGQAVTTSLALLVAEELDVDVDQIRVEAAPVAPQYVNVTLIMESMTLHAEGEGLGARATRWGVRKVAEVMQLQLTGGSSSVRDAFGPMREAGATVREILKAAAAAEWGVPASELRTESGKVINTNNGGSATYAYLARNAANMTPPETVTLREPSAWRLLGKDQARLEIPAVVDGSAVFGADVTPDGLIYAAIRHAPAFGSGAVEDWDRSVLDKPGILDVVEVPGGIAVVADQAWRALREARDLTVSFAPPTDLVSSAKHHETLLAALDQDPSTTMLDQGDAPAALAQAENTVEATLSVPHLAHTCLEPMTATVLMDDAGVSVWAPTQAPAMDRMLVADLLDVAPETVTIHVTRLGGGFGRKAGMEPALQAATIAAKHRSKPVQVLWSREEDIQHDTYRPATAARIKASLDAEGKVSAWHGVVATSSVAKSFATRTLGFGSSMGDKTRAEGLEDPIYDFGAARLDVVDVDTQVPLGFWRSVGHSFTGFFGETMMDVLAEAAGQDPVSFRLAHLGNHPRHAKVLEAAVADSGWLRPRPEGTALGVALHPSFGSIVAMVAEVTLDDYGMVRVPHVWAAADVGTALQPQTVKDQVEGGMLFGLSAALWGDVTIEDGAVVDGNYDTQRVVSLAETPKVSVTLVDTGGPIGGVGEIGTPPIAAAVANGLAKLTGVRSWDLPLLDLGGMPRVTA